MTHDESTAPNVEAVNADNLRAAVEAILTAMHGGVF